MNIFIKAVNYIWLHTWKYRAVKRQHRQYVSAMRGRKPVNVVFMAIDLALWRYQYLYDIMNADERFCVSIVLSPCLGREQKEQDMKGLRDFFDQNHIKYIDYNPHSAPYDIKNELNPDIIFYTQPYEYLLTPEHDCRAFYNRLVCYMPYGFNTFAKWSYNLHFCNLAWRLYYPTKESLEQAMKLSDNHGENVRISGYANADGYFQQHHHSVWKVMNDGKNRKRIIWAPHFTIQKQSETIPARSNFLWMADFMLHLAQEYKDLLQISFKPHPTLLTRLYQHKEWGKTRTDAYYEQWRSMANTQLETGEYVDLFMTSDAMIHDCASFSGEYHYSEKPVMFVSKDVKSVLSQLSSVGQKALSLHYLGATYADIRHFIDDVVLGENDPMRPQREQFVKDYLLPPGGKSVAQNVLDDIVESLHLND